MQIIILSPDLPLPADTGGRIRIWSIIQGLARDHEVHLFALCDAYPSAEIEARILQVVASAKYIVQPRWKRYMYGLFAMLSLFPFHVGALYSSALHKILSECAAQLDPDVIFVNFIWMTQYIQHFPNAIAVLDQQNYDLNWWKNYTNTTENKLKKFILLVNTGLVKLFEKQAYKAYDLCFSVCEEDKIFTQPLIRNPENVFVAPNGVDIESFFPLSTVVKENSIVFVGSMDVAANIIAVEFFVHQVLPLIWQEQPDATFTIVGRRPVKSVQKLAQDPRITVTGSVEEVQPYLAAAHVVVVPHLAPGGTKLKLINAMAMGKAIVASPAGAHGIEVEVDQHLLMAATPKDYADQVIRLLKDYSLCASLGRNARILVEEQYSWSSIVKNMEQSIRGYCEKNIHT